MRKPKTYKLSLMTKRSLWGWLFVLPFLIGLVFFVISPLFTSIVLSFNKQVEIGSGKIGIVSIGWEAYKYAFTEQATFLQKLSDSLTTFLIRVPSVLMFSFLMANILNQNFRGRTVARAVLFMPVITASGVAANMLGSWLYYVTKSSMDQAGSSAFNLADSIRATIQNMPVFGSGVGSFVVTAFSQLNTIVMSSGVPILIFLAGLQTISPSIFESSKVEGATAWENFWKITFPMISPMILVNTIYTMIDVLSGMGSPMLAWLYGIRESTSAVATSYNIMAMSWIYFLLTAIVVGLVSFVMSKFVYYEN